MSRAMRIKKEYFTVTLSMTLSLLGAFAHAQTNTTHSAIEVSKAPARAECQQLDERTRELDQLEQQRLMERGTKYESKRPIQSQEWIRQQRKDIQTKMFFAKC